MTRVGLRIGLRVLPWLVAMVGVLTPLSASEVKIFRVNTQKALLEGTLDGVSLDPLGRLQLAERAERLAQIEEPFLLSAAAHPDGVVVGTGNDGKVLLIKNDGTTEELFHTEEPEVFAVLVDRRGRVYAGSSPKGKVYRYSEGEAAVFFEPEESYIWALAESAKGLLVATGDEGKLYRVDDKGEGEVLYDSEEPHLRSLLARADGTILIGTAGEGLLLELRADGQLRTLYDAAGPEIMVLAPGPEGRVYGAVLASEASLVDLTRSAQTRSSSSSGSSESSDDDDKSSEGTVKVESGAVSVGSRPATFRGPRSEILEIGAAGSVETLWKFDKETVFSLAWLNDRLWVGTGLEGQLYSYRGRQMVLEKDLEESQVVALLPGDAGPAIATTNAAALYRVVSGHETEGTFTSDVLDAGDVARFGTLHWEGLEPENATVEFSARSGMSAIPDATWSKWTAPKRGREVELKDVPEARYVQWRAHFAGDKATPTVVEVELAYLQRNRRPEIESLEILGPGEVLVPANFNPANQVYEPASPNRDGIFTALEPSGNESGRLKSLWKKGYRTLRWKAEDPNDDELEYAVEFRSEDGADEWLPIAREIDDSHYSFDSTVLPDGRYRFRVRASDRPSNNDGGDLEALYTSERAVVDHSPPTLSGVEKQGSRLIVEIADRLSPLREVVYSVDAKAWKPATAVDGLVDSRSESLVLEVGKGARLLLLRATDAAFNVVTHDLSRELP